MAMVAADVLGIIGLLGLALAVPGRSTLSRRAETLHLLVDSTGLKLCGAGEWLVEKHGTKARRSWRTLHVGVDDGAEVGNLVHQVREPVASFTGDGAYGQEGVSAAIAERHPEAAVIVPPRSTAAPSGTAAPAPAQRDRHLHSIAERGRAAWQKASSYTKRAQVKAAIARFKQVIGDGLRSRTDRRRATEVDVAAHALNHMLGLGRLISVRIG